MQKSSILFSKNVPTHIRTQIRNIFPVTTLSPNTMHLGHPLIFSHKDKNKAYRFIHTMFFAKFANMKANKLNHVSRLQYIKSVLSSIPAYYMCQPFFSLRPSLILVGWSARRFWWAGVQEENGTNPIAFRSWNDICQPTSNGGLGIRNMELINKSLPIHYAWNIATNKNPLLTSIMKSKYFPDSSFLTARSNMPRSVFWSSVLQVKHYLHENTAMQINRGNSSIWSTPWMDQWSTIHDNLIMPITNLPLPANISDLWL
jgi:hypothetical protein